MKKVQAQLKTIAKSLTSLADKIEKLNAQMAAAPAPKAAKAPAKTKAPAKKKVAAKKAAAPKKKAAAKAPAKADAAEKETVLDKVLDVISKSRNGATIATLKSKTSLESRQLSNALYKLSKKGKIKAQARGVYVKA
jgi:predicted Rossmann fold nucleotide-binding protein DprA/Smf involved in DNA uptake